MDEPWLSQDQQGLWRRWIAVHSALPAALNRQLSASCELSLADFEVLVYLSEAEEDCLRMTALAEVMGWEQSRLSHQVGRMEKRGLVDRERCPSDGRGLVVTITEQGYAQLRTAAPGHARTVKQLLFEGFSDEEIRALSKMLDGVLHRIESDG